MTAPCAISISLARGCTPAHNRMRRSESLNQCFFLECSKDSACETSTTLERLSARFSFRDLPDFLVMVCRGDLSDIATPSLWGPMSVPVDRVYAATGVLVHRNLADGENRRCQTSLRTPWTPKRQHPESRKTNSIHPSKLCENSRRRVRATPMVISCSRHSSLIEQRPWGASAALFEGCRLFGLTHQEILDRGHIVRAGCRHHGDVRLVRIGIRRNDQ